MQHFAVDVTVGQTRILNTETVVRANTAEEARTAALTFFQTQVFDPTSDAQFITDSLYEVKEPREIQFLDDGEDEESSVPYVYDLNRKCIISVQSRVQAPVVDLDDNPFSDIALWTTPVDVSPVAASVATSVDTTSQYWAVEISWKYTFQDRATKDMIMPLCTDERGWTPIDGEWRFRRTRPYYLGGPSPITIGNAVYGAPVVSSLFIALPVVWDTYDSETEEDECEDGEEWEEWPF
jgi:hypothetical protein